MKMWVKVLLVGEFILVLLSGSYWKIEIPLQSKLEMPEMVTHHHILSNVNMITYNFVLIQRIV